MLEKEELQVIFTEILLIPNDMIFTQMFLQGRMTQTSAWIAKPTLNGLEKILPIFPQWSLIISNLHLSELPNKSRSKLGLRNQKDVYFIWIFNLFLC